VTPEPEADCDVVYSAAALTVVGHLERRHCHLAEQKIDRAAVVKGPVVAASVVQVF